MKKLLLSLLFFPAIAFAANYQFGDSITVGVGASSTARGYAQVLGPTLGGAISNSALSGGMVPDQATALYGKSFTASDKTTIMLGTNDERIYGTNATKQAYFRNGVAALAAYSSSVATKAASAGSYTGSWETTVAYGIGKNSFTEGSKVSFNVAGTVVYIGYIKQSGNGGQFTVKIDGVSKGTFTSNGSGINTYLGATYGPQLARFDGLSNAIHAVEIEVISATSSANRVYIDWWGSNATARTPTYVANIPYATSYPSGGSNANVDLYNGEILAMVNQLSGDGLPVHYIDVNSVLTPSDMYDAYHPNDAGHLKIFRQFYKSINNCSCP